MSISRREFLQVLAVASAAGMSISHHDVLVAKESASEQLYDAPAFGNVSFMHFTDCHAQLMPIYYREPSMNLGISAALGKPPHLVGNALLRQFGVAPHTAQAHAFTHLDFVQAAKTFGKVGGFAHLATLVKRIRTKRPHALLLDGGDTWQGSATALWTRGQDMVDACKLLGVNCMSSHWEYTLGAARVKEIVEKDFKNKVSFLAQNVTTSDFGDQVFEPYTMREMNGVSVAIIGQAFPYTPIANPRYMVSEWTFGIQEEHMQQVVNEVRQKGAQVVVVLSHNGMDVDLKMASRVTGIDAILGGHTHDGVPTPVVINNANGQTLVTNAGSNGKFLAVLDFDVRMGKIQGFQYRLMPVFSNLLPADREMQSYIDTVRAPFQAKLDEQLAVSESLLYRRGNFNGSWDQLIVDALMEVKGAEIAFSPGFRWGTSILPGQKITRSDLMDQVAITYPATTLNNMTGEMLKSVLEDVCDNLFNPDPYYQQGGDMVRVGGLQYTCTPNAKVGSRINNLTLRGKPIDPHKSYKVAGWASVAEGVVGEPIWDVMESYFKAHPVITPRQINQPKIIGVKGNLGLAS